MNFRYTFITLFFAYITSAQVLDAEVIVDAKQTGRNQLSIFTTLENDLTEFINNTQWTDDKLSSHQQLQCSFNIIVQAYDADNFQATLQVQSSRPVFNSTLNTVVLNIKDNDFNFRYKEFEPLNYNPNQFSNNLVSTISFYIYTILGFDADSFKLNSGDEFYEEARKIVNAARQRGGTGWTESGSSQSRFGINRDLLSSNFSDFREAIYIYHREGLDVMHNDVEEGKIAILDALDLISTNYEQRPNSAIFRIYFDSKSDEIMQILAAGPEVDIQATLATLKQIAPVHNRKWKMIAN